MFTPNGLVGSQVCTDDHRKTGSRIVNSAAGMARWAPLHLTPACFPVTALLTHSWHTAVGNYMWLSEVLVPSAFALLTQHLVLSKSMY